MKIRELGGQHQPETEEYGLSSVVFRSPKPFHPERLWNYLDVDYPANIIRAKGMFWIASRRHEALSFSQAGGSLRVDHAGTWWASMPFNERIQYTDFTDNQQEIESRWSANFGDRMNELVLIGQHMDKSQLLSGLSNCLINNEEMEAYVKQELFSDPLMALLDQI